jgi:hypothetical protein
MDISKQVVGDVCASTVEAFVENKAIDGRVRWKKGMHCWPPTRSVSLFVRRQVFRRLFLRAMRAMNVMTEIVKSMQSP